MTNQYVWVIESGDYADRSVAGVAANVEAAAQHVKKPYGSPYIVRWDEPVREDDEHWSLTGHFSRVPDYCGDGPITWDFTRHGLIE